MLIFRMMRPTVSIERQIGCKKSSKCSEYFMSVCASHNDKATGSAYSVGHGKVGPYRTIARCRCCAAAFPDAVVQRVTQKIGHRKVVVGRKLAFAALAPRSDFDLIVQYSTIPFYSSEFQRYFRTQSKISASSYTAISAGLFSVNLRAWGE